MAKGFKAGGGGGGNPLNFKVVGNPKPENPKENTIWVDTDEAIPEWMISADEPSGMRAENESVGSVVTMNDSSEAGLTALTLYGKTIQNGTPSPDAPVPLETVGADGNVAVTVCGKNLLNMPKRTVNANGIDVVAEGTLLTLSGTATGTLGFDFLNNTVSIQPGTYTFSAYNLSAIPRLELTLTDTDGTKPVNNLRITASAPKTTFTIAKPCKVNLVFVIANGTVLGGESNPTIISMQIESGSVATAYEPYKTAQTLTAQTPNGLPGIPVSSGGNYIDENGQRWICDEIDFVRGKYVKRIGTKIFKGTEAFTQISSNTNCWRVVVPEMWTETAGGSDFNTVLALSCSHFKPVLYTGASQAEDGTVTFYSTGEHIIRFTHNSKAVPEYMAEQYDSGNPVKVLYKLAVSVETDLTAEEISAYSALHTNYPTTTVYNDEGADMKVGYVSNPKEGFVWIKTGTSSQTGFNALKKNGIYIHPILAKQYIDGARVIKTAQIYQRGAWRDWFDGVIFRNGAKNDHITGGWDGYTSGTVLTVNKSNSPRTNNHIDLTGFKKLYVTFVTADRPTDGSGTPAGSYGIRVYLSTVSGATPVDIGAISAGTLSADISNIDEPVMIKCDAHTYQNGGSGTISAIWCE